MPEEVVTNFDVVVGSEPPEDALEGGGAEIAVVDGDQLDHLCRQLAAIITECAFTARGQVIKAKWCVGKELLNAPQSGRKGFVNEVLRRLHEEMPGSELAGWSRSELYRCARFAQQFPDLDLDVSDDGLNALAAQLGEGKAMSWNRVLQLLPHDKEDSAPPKERWGKRKEQLISVSGMAIGQVWTAEKHQQVLDLL